MNKKRKKYQRRLKVGSLLSIVVVGALVGIIACAFVIIKNANAPISAPKILDKILLIKYFEIKPIKIMLPQVKNTMS